MFKRIIYFISIILLGIMIAFFLAPYDKEKTTREKLLELNYDITTIENIFKYDLEEEFLNSNDNKKEISIINYKSFNIEYYDLYKEYYNEDLTYIDKLNILKEKEYSLEEIESIFKKDIDYETFTSLLNSKNFYKPYLDKYLAYKEENKDLSLDQVLLRINTGIDKPFYTNIKPVENPNSLLVLVNKYYQLDRNFVPSNLTYISSGCSYGSGFMLKKEAAAAFEEVCKDAKKEGLNILIYSSYRSYNSQAGTYNGYVQRSGRASADTYSARPGHSEHQTGLAADVRTPNTVFTSFGTTREYSWLKDNAHKYGFIRRYTKETQYITGYMSEEWHYRYVGVEAATYIYENNITFEEYYLLKVK